MATGNANELLLALLDGKWLNLRVPYSMGYYANGWTAALTTHWRIETATRMSSAMVYGLLPVFLVKILNTSIASVGLIEGIAEATASLTKIVSGVTSDWLGRRKPIVLLGYALSAANKLLFPLAGDASTVLIARVIDRVGIRVR